MHIVAEDFTTMSGLSMCTHDSKGHMQPCTAWQTLSLSQQYCLFQQTNYHSDWCHNSHGNMKQWSHAKSKDFK